MPWTIPPRPVTGDTDWTAEQEAIWASLKAFVDAQEAAGDPYGREISHEKELAIYNGGVSQVSGSLYVAYFTARRSRSVTTLAAFSHTTASAGLTLARMGLYSADASDNLTLLAGTANDTTLFNTANTAYDRAITATPLTKGGRYAFGLLAVGTTPGNRKGYLGGASDTGLASRTPRVAGVLTGQTDLPASVSSASLATTGMNVSYMEAF